MLQQGLRNGNIEITKQDPAEVARLIKSAHLQRKGADFNREDFPELAYNAAYFSIINACDALLVANGYRARGFGGHEVALNCAAELLMPTSNAVATTLKTTIRRTARKVRCRVMYGGEPAGRDRLQDIIRHADSILRVIEPIATRKSKASEFVS